MSFRMPKWINFNYSTRYLTIREVETRKKLLNQIRAHLKENLSAEVYREVNCELVNLFLN